MGKKIVSLTALFLKNTFAFMRYDTIDQTITGFESYIFDEIEALFKEIINILNEKATAEINKNATLSKKWRIFEGEKWGYNCLVRLREVEKCLVNAEKGTISKEFLVEIKKYYREVWPEKSDNLNSKFSKSSLKLYKDYTKYTNLSLNKINMLVDGFIVPFFKDHTTLYEDYIKWLKHIDNFFSIEEKGEKIIFPYSQQQYDWVQGCVALYSDFEEFDEKNFCDFLTELLYRLESISSERANVQKEVNIQEENDNIEDIRKDIEKYFHELFSYPGGTIGILKEEVDNMLWSAANDTIENYMYIKESKNMTWSQCKDHNGFNALMRYRLYSILASKKENQFLSQYARTMEKETKEKYGVYISEYARVANRVWVDENCQIGKCYIESDVNILSGVVLGDNIVVKCGSVVGPKAHILYEKY